MQLNGPSGNRTDNQPSHPATSKHILSWFAKFYSFAFHVEVLYLYWLLFYCVTFHFPTWITRGLPDGQGQCTCVWALRWLCWSNLFWPAQHYPNHGSFVHHAFPKSPVLCFFSHILAILDPCAPLWIVESACQLAQTLWAHLLDLFQEKREDFVMI